MNDDPILLASAYLDGDVDADERALVESDPELLAEVDRLRSVRALLHHADSPPISTREEHLAGALAAWDRIPDAERTGATRDLTPRGIGGAAAAGAASVSAPTRLGDRRRRTMSTRWLTAAAAALVLVLAGGVVLQLNSTTNDDDSVSGEAQSDATSAADVAAGNAELRSEALEADDAGGASEDLADSATDGTQLDTGIDTAAPPGDDDLVVLLTPQDLASFAADSLEAPSTPDVPAATSAPADLSESSTLSDDTLPLCLGVDDIVGPARYDSVSVVVGIDISRDIAIAYTVPDCEEIARVRLP